MAALAARPSALAPGRLAARRRGPIALLAPGGALALLLALALGLLAAAAAIDYVYAGRIYPGVHALGRDLGGLTAAEAAVVLRAAEAGFLARPVRIEGRATAWEASLRDLGLRLDVEATAAEAAERGREGGFGRLIAPLQARLGGWTVEPQLAVDPEQRERVVRYLSATIDRPVVDARFTVLAEGEVAVLPAQTGLRVELEPFEQAVEAVAQGRDEAVALRIVETPPAIREGDLEALRPEAARFLAEPLALTYGQERWPLDRARLAELLTLPAGRRGGPAALVLNGERLESYLAELAAGLNRPARDARFRYTGSQVVVVEPSQDGLEVDVAGTAAAILDAFQRGESTAPLVARVEPPAIETGERDRIVLRDRLAWGLSDYAGGIPERLHNVELATRRLDGVLVPPGGLFSFNQALGPATIQNGFKWGFGIASDESGKLATVPSEAGGICQVATTLFQAAFRAGLQVEERNAHSYWIPRYAAPPTGMFGLDATVDDPNVDLKLRNNTGNWLAITTSVDTVRKDIVIEFWGTDPGWQVQIDQPAITDYKKTNYEIVYQEADFLPYGEIWVESAQDGFTAAITRTVKDRSGQTILGPSTFVSVYQPARNVKLVRRGTAPR